MTGHIYYAIGLLVILSSLTMIMKFKKMNSIREWFDKYKVITGNSPEKADFRSKEESDLYRGISTLGIFEFMWVIGGLLTSSWYVFLSLFIYALIVGLIIKPFKYTFFGSIISIHFLLLKIVVYLFLVINHFHLHYDIFNIIKNHI